MTLASYYVSDKHKKYRIIPTPKNIDVPAQNEVFGLNIVFV